MRSIRLATLGLFTMMAVMVAAATTAAAAPDTSANSISPLATCVGSGCTGVEPHGTTCANDAITALSRSAEGATVQLRYSPSCRAAWGKEVNGLVGDKVCVKNTIGAQECATINSGTDNHTRMVNDMNITSHACMS